MAEIVTVAALAITLASTAISYDSAQTQAKQAQYNAQAQANEIGRERQRQALQEEENRRRAVVEQRRVRAQQLNAMASGGALLGTGSPLALEADTWAKQQTELADQQRLQMLSERNLAYQQTATLELGSQQASAIRRDATGQAISGLASAAGGAYSSWTTRPTRAAA